mgnify:CR=1 FL=1
MKPLQSRVHHVTSCTGLLSKIVKAQTSLETLRNLFRDLIYHRLENKIYPMSPKNLYEFFESSH